MNIKRKLCIALLFIFSCAIFLPTTAFAAGTCTFSVGTNYGSSDINTSSDATKACDLYNIAGYSSYYSTMPTVSIMRGNFSNGVKRIRSDILFFSGHANYNNMCFNYNGNGGNYKTGVYYKGDLDSSTTGYKYVGLSGNMGTVKLATFAGCLTASNNGNNIAANAVYYGAKASVGWSSSVNAGSHSNWLARYNDKLATGATVSEAAIYANSFIYLDSKVKDVRIYGNIDQTIKLTRSTSVLAEELNLKKNVISSDVNILIDNELNTDTIADIIANNYSGFNSDEYEVAIHTIYDGCYTVDFTKVIDSIETNSCYTVVIINNKVVEIIDNTKAIDEQNFKSTVSPKISARSLNNIAYNEAKEATEKSAYKKANEQTSKYYYDIDSGELSLVVFTTYYFDGTNSMGKDIFNQKIDL